MARLLHLISTNIFFPFRSGITFSTHIPLPLSATRAWKGSHCLKMVVSGQGRVTIRSNRDRPL